MEWSGSGAKRGVMLMRQNEWLCFFCFLWESVWRLMWMGCVERKDFSANRRRYVWTQWVFANPKSEGWNRVRVLRGY